MRNQRLIEALMRIQAAMDFCRERKAGALKYVNSAREAMALAPEYLKDSELTRKRARLIAGHLDNAADELRRGHYENEAKDGPHGSAYDLLRVAHEWIGQLIKFEAMPKGTLTCAVCKRSIRADETVYANRRTGFSCAQCVTPDPGNCPGCGTPKNNAEPGFCMACLGDTPDLRENR